MAKSIQKTYNRKRPAHPDEAHTKSKRWFKKKGRKRLRSFLKSELRRDRVGNNPTHDFFFNSKLYCITSS